MTRRLPGLEHVEGNRYREDPGLAYEDFRVGDVYEHWPGRTVTETDNIWFTNLTMNTHPLHFDRNYAANDAFAHGLRPKLETLRQSNKVHFFDCLKQEAIHEMEPVYE